MTFLEYFGVDISKCAKLDTLNVHSPKKVLKWDSENTKMTSFNQEVFRSPCYI